MGQKVNPVGLRVGINRGWDSKWYANKKKYDKTLHQDFIIEKLMREKMDDAGLSKVEILRTANAVTINVHTSKPGIIIGRGGEKIESLREELEKKFGIKFSVNIIEIKKPNLDAQLVAESIANQVSRRISYRRAAKMAIDKCLEAGAEGVKIRVAGRLNGVEIARSEFFSKGKIPLHTLRADIDYAYLPAGTTYGVIGIKVWIYKGQIFEKGLSVNTTEVPGQKDEMEPLEPKKPSAPKKKRPNKTMAAKKKPAAKKATKK
jgi:small subunit ribosomal protein S3